MVNNIFLEILKGLERKNLHMRGARSPGDLVFMGCREEGTKGFLDLLGKQIGTNQETSSEEKS